MRITGWVSLAAAVAAPLFASAQVAVRWARPQAAYSALTTDTTRPLPAMAAGTKSPGAALAISLGGTLGLLGAAAALHKGGDNSKSAFLAGAAFIIAPAGGYWYGDSPKWTSGMITRGIALGVGALGVLVWNSSGDAGGLLMVTGASVIVVSGIIDIARVQGAVREANQPAPPVSLLPAFGLDGKSAGLNLRITF